MMLQFEPSSRRVWKKRIKRWLFLTLVAATYVVTYCTGVRYGYYRCDKYVKEVLKDAIIITP